MMLRDPANLCWIYFSIFLWKFSEFSLLKILKFSNYMQTFQISGKKGSAQPEVNWTKPTWRKVPDLYNFKCDMEKIFFRLAQSMVPRKPVKPQVLFTFILNYVLASEIPSNEYCIINMELVISLSITYRLLQSQHNTWNHRINVPAGYKDFMEIHAIRRRAVTVYWHQQIKYCLTREATRVCN